MIDYAPCWIQGIGNALSFEPGSWVFSPLVVFFLFSLCLIARFGRTPRAPMLRQADPSHPFLAVAHRKLVLLEMSFIHVLMFWRMLVDLDAFLV